MRRIDALAPRRLRGCRSDKTRAASAKWPRTSPGERAKHLAVLPRWFHIALAQQSSQSIDISAQGREFGTGRHQRRYVLGAAATARQYGHIGHQASDVGAWIHARMLRGLHRGAGLLAAHAAVIESYARAKAQGVTIVKPPRTTWRGTSLHELWLRDPTEYGIEVYARLTPEERATMPADQEPTYLVSGTGP